MVRKASTQRKIVGVLADFNKQLHEKGIETYITVQKICRSAKDEEEIKETITKMWNQPKKARIYLNHLMKNNKEIFEFEKNLELMNVFLIIL